MRKQSIFHVIPFVDCLRENKCDQLAQLSRIRYTTEIRHLKHDSIEVMKKSHCFFRTQKLEYSNTVFLISDRKVAKRFSLHLSLMMIAKTQF